ncbi:MAG: deoxyribodipyrimidine photo-lyase [Melioribacteraceae bacterium]|nr:deoxyribodipyrimidine photo-lyase [Melioribacteraceae bacterium]MCF8412493.1 deoxyribodipyrimidine photo-lyase [Melioribacteraceae bacterium]MCF8431692.1 deoxyribodipyrimidine photo-lyase [Melioribacteraceae bacterium]
MNENRLKILKDGEKKTGPVVYWMQRDQRANDNWALIYAQSKACEMNVDLRVVFNLVPEFLEATVRQYEFMIKGLEEVEQHLNRFNIPFNLFLGEPEQNLPRFLEKIHASLLVVDFNPLKIARFWKKKVADKIQIPIHEVDTHNIVPCKYVSDKIEYAAYTIRPKIKRNLDEFLDEIPPLLTMENNPNLEKVDWEKARNSLKINFSVPEVDWLIPGESTAKSILEKFINQKLESYNQHRNDPNLNALSNLSPYFHFGQISPQRVALAVSSVNNFPESKDAFLEELIVRRELSDNFCYYNSKYDSFEGFHDWAKKTLNEHREDKREFIYRLEQFENAETHDGLWNAAQIEVIKKGKMHGFMRMYWAKKILEWTESPEQALEFALYLNDKYQLDGRDPNGYVGVAWSIGGVHDRAWTERPVFGKIRFMNYNGCKRKFDIKSYILNNQK